jgi:hypothetical protein
MKARFGALGTTAIAVLILTHAESMAAPSWGIDLTNANLAIDADGYADNGVNGFRPLPGAFFQDLASADESDIQANYNASFFGQPPETFDLGAGVNIFGGDEGFNPDFRTEASAVGVIGIKGVGTRTLEIFFRATTDNSQRDFHDMFLSDSMANLTAQIVATIEGVAPGTPLTIGYDWEYLGLAVIEHEAGIEDPTFASGSLSFVDEQGNGPGNLFSILFAEPGPLGGADTDNGSHNMTTSMTADPSFLTIDLATLADTIMNFPGDPVGGATQRDQAGSTFNGRLTLTLPVPEPGSVLLLLTGGFAALLARTRLI